MRMPERRSPEVRGSSLYQRADGKWIGSLPLLTRGVANVAYSRWLPAPSSRRARGWSKTYLPRSTLQRDPMSIPPTVVFALSHEAGSDLEQDFLDTGRRTLSTLPGVQDFTVNRQVSAKTDLARQFSMNFASQQEYDADDAHPYHREFVATCWQREVARFQEYDFVVQPG